MAPFMNFYQFVVLSLSTKIRFMGARSVEALLIGFNKSHNMTTKPMYYLQSSRQLCLLQRYLTDIAWSNCMSVKVHPDDQVLYDSFN